MGDVQLRAKEGHQTVRSHRLRSAPYRDLEIAPTTGGAKALPGGAQGAGDQSPSASHRLWSAPYRDLEIAPTTGGAKALPGGAQGAVDQSQAQATGSLPWPSPETIPGT